MNRLFAIFFILNSLLTLRLIAAEKSIQTSSGSLKELINDSEYGEIKSLILTGTINQTDILFIRDNLNQLENLNIKGCEITEYSIFKANELPEYSFYKETENSENIIRLKNIVLPEKLKIIGANSFRDCINL